MYLAFLLLMIQPVVQDKVADRFVPAPYDAQRLSGYLAERMKINLEGRLLHIDEQAVLAGFQTRPGVHPWIGEHVGKYLDAACNTWVYTQDPRLKTQMDRIAGELLKTQLPDGYFGTYADKDRWTSWDAWVHKYNLIGLLAYYRVTGDKRVLDACRRIGDLLAATFGEGKRDIIASSTHVGMAATSVLEPVVSLYRYTGEKRYLEFALYIVRSWEQPNGPKLLSSLLSHGRVDQTANAKAYEMMSDLVGLVDLYRVTGTEDYRKAATAAWTDIAAHRVFPTGTTSTHEHFQADGVFPGEEANDVGEGCATVTWLQLSWQLLRLTGEAQYGEELERTVFNQLLAAQDTANGNICYFTPLNGRKRPGPGINCCVSSEPRGISMIPALAWGRSADGIDIELYTAGEYTASFRGGLKVKIKSETTFPASGDVTFTITPSFRTRFALNLRVPKWTARYTARVEKVTRPGTPGSYLTINRRWEPGDVVTVSMEMTERVLEGGPSYPGRVAFLRGAQALVLARDVNPKDQVPYLTRAAVENTRLQGFQLAGLVLRDGKLVETPLRLMPFADAREEYRFWLPPAATLSAAPVSVTVGGRESLSSRNETVHGSITDERADTWRATRPGQSKPDQDDWFAVELLEPHAISRIVFQHGPSSAGGAFAGKPKVQVQTLGSKEWVTVATVDSYPAPSFEVHLPQPAIVAAIRVAGRPAGKFTTCAQLDAFE